MSTSTMTLEEQLRLKALADPMLSSIIGNRWGVMLDQTPCVTYQQVSGVPEVSHSEGDAGIEACRYQISMHTTCVLDAIRVMARLKSLFSGFKGRLGAAGEGDAVTIRIMNAVQHGKQSGVNLFYATMDLMIWWCRELEA